MTTEEEGQYYIKNKQFPIDSFVLGYVTYITGNDEYKTNLDKMKSSDSPYPKMIANWLDPKQTPNRLLIFVLYRVFPQFGGRTIKPIIDNWQYPDTPLSPSEQLFSKNGYDIGDSTVFKCNQQSLLLKSTKNENERIYTTFDKLPDEIPYFEFIDKEKPCNPCVIINYGDPATPPCQFTIASSSPELFKILWGIQPTSVETDKNTSTNSFSGFDAATAKGTGTTETKPEDPAVTASDQNKQVAQNDADAKKAQLDVDSKKAEVDKQNADARKADADARKADAEATKAENEANKKPWF